MMIIKDIEVSGKTQFLMFIWVQFEPSEGHSFDVDIEIV